jgi:predicted TIM-barrel fold metal-dependent hydrolase
MTYSGKIIDAHTHIMNSGINTEKPHGLTLMERANGYDNFCLMSLEATQKGQNDDCFVLAEQTGCYVFAGLDHDNKNYVEQAEKMIQRGAAGFKMIEGKPNVYKTLNESLNSPCNMDFYRYLESRCIPLLLHAGDPAEFWSKDTAPAFAVENGWTYDKEGFPSLEHIRREVSRIADSFPNLKMVLAHFYFLAHDLDAVVNLFDTYKNISFDICPGTEMFSHFTKRNDDWRRFFIDYSDRIIFGTDNFDGDFAVKKEINRMIHCFLQTPFAFKVWDLELNGIHLPQQALARIYHGNFERLIDPKR